MRSLQKIDRRPALALVFCLVSATIALRTLWVAVTLEPLPSGAAPDLRRDVQPIEPLPETPGGALVATVINDPFHPQRKPAAGRFQPGGPDTSHAADTAPPSRGSVLKLLGTVVLPEGGLAMVEGQGESRMVRVGESFAGFRLRQVERGQAVFVTANGARQVLAVENGES